MKRYSNNHMPTPLDLFRPCALPVLLSIAVVVGWCLSADRADAADSAAAVMIPAQAPRDTMPDPADLVAWPEEIYPVFSPSSPVNATWLMDAPAGKHGPVAPGKDGRLRFGDGTPARFWGTTLVYGMTFPEKKEEIVPLADAIAAYGYNLVRFHHNDLNWRGIGYIKAGSSYELDPTDIDRLDLLASELIKRGIYLYVDCLDSRQLLADVGLEGWEDMKDNTGWKGLFPHPAVVAAWKRAAQIFLDHTNPYTGRRWADEPAVAVVECINENGPFWDWNFKISARFRTWCDQQWNAWLRDAYHDRANLDKQWTDANGQAGLFADEDPAKDNVFHPPLAPVLEWDRPNHSKTRGAARVNDYYRFLADQSRGFYEDAVKHLRGIGYKSLIIGSHELQGPLDEFTEARSTGTLASHLYANAATAWGARPGSKGVVVEGVDVRSNNWFANLLRVKVAGVPGVNGEWTGGSLTNRADVNVAVAAACAFQRVDASAHFSLAHRWAGAQLPAKDCFFDWQDYRKAFGMTFTSMHDIPWMSANRVCAAIFIRGDLAPAKVKVHVAYSDEDLLEQNLHALGISGGGGTIGDAALFLPLIHQVECISFATAYEGDADVVFMTGRTASGDYRKARHAVLVGDNPYLDHHHQRRDLGAPARAVAPGVKIATLEKPTVFTVTAPWRAARKLSFARYEGAIERASVPTGATPIGTSEDGAYVLGWIDDRFLVLPNGRAFGDAIHDTRWLYRLYLEACHRWKIPVGANSADAGEYVTDTGEMTVDWAHGTMVIDTPRTQGFSGYAGLRGDNRASHFACAIEQPYATVLLTSVDGRPLAESARMLLVANGRDQNTGEVVETKAGGHLELVKSGSAPILVEALRGSATLRGVKAKELTVRALDHRGRRLGTVETTATDDTLTIPLSPRWKTVWFEISSKESVGEDAPAADIAAWPAAAGAAPVAVTKPKLIALDAFFAAINQPGDAPSGGTAAPAAGARVVLAEGAALTPQAYGNAKAANGADGAELTFGKINQEWYGGVGFAIVVPAGTDASACTGIVLSLKGDGTQPREAYLDLKLAGGGSFRSRNINAMFESDDWHEVVLSQVDFKASGKDQKDAPIAWDKIQRIDVSCVGPLMEAKSQGVLRSVQLAMKAADAAAPGTPDQQKLPALPPITPLEGPRLAIPFVPGATFEADGKPTEAAWRQAVGIAMDEDQVPAWQFTGTFLATGTRSAKETASFWLVATEEGLGLVAVVDKGEATVIANQGDWWRNDCVEVFSDAKLALDKPTKQLFLAYRRADVDKAAASDAGIRIGRASLARGYLLEALIPWASLGFAAMPVGEFGIDLQADIVHANGASVQLCYATGTNEAYMSAKRYLTAKIRTP